MINRFSRCSTLDIIHDLDSPFCSSIYPFNGHFFSLETRDGPLGYKPCTKNIIDLHSAYTLFAKAPRDTVKTVTQAAKEICAEWNDRYSRSSKASMLNLIRHFNVAHVDFGSLPNCCIFLRQDKCVDFDALM